MLHSRDFKKIYHPKMGKYVYQHRGNGLIVDNILKPIGRKLKDVGVKVVAPFLKEKAKKAFSKGAERAGEILIKKAAEQSGDLIRRRLDAKTKKPTKGPTKKSQQDVNAILNNLIAMS